MAAEKPQPLVVRLPAQIERRLRVQAAILRQAMTQVVADVLNEGLPSAADLAARMREGEVSDDRAS